MNERFFKAVKAIHELSNDSMTGIEDAVMLLSALRADIDFRIHTLNGIMRKEVKEDDVHLLREAPERPH